jgi:hypothetical protein
MFDFIILSTVRKFIKNNGISSQNDLSTIVSPIEKLAVHLNIAITYQSDYKNPYIGPLLWFHTFCLMKTLRVNAPFKCVCHYTTNSMWMHNNEHFPGAYTLHNQRYEFISNGSVTRLLVHFQCFTCARFCNEHFNEQKTRIIHMLMGARSWPIGELTAFFKHINSKALLVSPESRLGNSQLTRAIQNSGINIDILQNQFAFHCASSLAISQCEQMNSHAPRMCARCRALAKSDEFRNFT